MTQHAEAARLTGAMTARRLSIRPSTQNWGHIRKYTRNLRGDVEEKEIREGVMQKG